MKKFLSFSLLAMLAVSTLSLVSCGKDDEPESTTTATLLFSSDVNSISTTYGSLSNDIATLVTTKANGLATIRNATEMSYIVLTVLPSNYATVANNLGNSLSEFQALCKKYSDCHFCKLSIPSATDQETSTSTKALVYLDPAYILEGTYSSTDNKYQFIATKTVNGDDNQFKATFVNDSEKIEGTLECHGASGGLFLSTDGQYQANINAYKKDGKEYISTTLYKNKKAVAEDLSLYKQ